MKQVFLLLLSVSLMSSLSAQDETSASTIIEKACLTYIEGFYEGDASKLKSVLSPKLHKFGYWKNEGGAYGDPIYMTYDGAMEYANDIKEKGNFAKADAPKIVEVMDVMDQIAAVKITAWWGHDYMLLSKVEGNWMIQEIIWQGPLVK